MKIIIAGTRDLNLDKDPVATNDFTEPNNIGRIIYRLLGDKVQGVTEVVSGNSGIIDQLGALWGSLFEKKVTLFNANWNKFGKAAGPIRNRQMAEYADALILIWDGKSRGSLSMRNEAKSFGLPIYEYIIK